MDQRKSPESSSLRRTFFGGIKRRNLDCLDQELHGPFKRWCRAKRTWMCSAVLWTKEHPPGSRVWVRSGFV